MITGWDIYWITRLDAIRHVTDLIAFISGLAMLLGIAWYFFELFEDGKQLWVVKHILKVVIPVFLVALICSVVPPTTKEAAAIYLLPKIVNNEQVQKLPDNAVKFLNVKLEAWIKDMAGAENGRRK